MLRCPKCQAELGDDRTICPHDGVVLLSADALSRAELLSSGTQVASYVVDEPIGSGTFGDVYRAQDPAHGRSVALKVLHRRFASDAKVVSRFMAEARAATQLRHPNIVEVYGFGTLPDGRHFQVMELLAGHTLEEELRARGRFPPAEALAVLGALASALSTCHAAGVVHRDLKPANVFLGLDRDGSWKPTLLDFGIAKLLSSDIPREHRTATGARIGTPYYMSPEQCAGPDVDHRSDIYAFGVLAYEMLTGSVPFRDSTVVGVLYQHTSVPPEAPTARQPALDPSFDAPLLTLLAKRPEARPVDIERAFLGLAAALEAASTAQTLPTPVADTVLRASSPSQPQAGSRWRWLSLLGLPAVVLAGLGLAQGRGERAPPPPAVTPPAAAVAEPAVKEVPDGGPPDVQALADAAAPLPAQSEPKPRRPPAPPASKKKGPDDLEDY